MSASFGELRMFGYNVILADPPWGFENWSEAGEGRNPNQHYDTMTADEIIAMPVGQLAAPDCAIFLWCVDPLLDRAFDALRVWGFRYVTVAFEWAKLNRSGVGWHMGTGYWTRANPEICLLGMMGRMQRASAAVRQLVVEPVRQHSRKPDRIRTDIEQLLGGPDHGVHNRCELFAARPARAGSAGATKSTNSERSRFMADKLTEAVERIADETHAFFHQAMPGVDVRRIAAMAANLALSRPKEALDHIEQLRAEEGDSVTILCDDPEATYKNRRLAVECNGSWTDWEDKRFYGENVRACLASAAEARAALRGSDQ